MFIQGCEGRRRALTIVERPCPRCGAPVEIFSVDSAVACDLCGQMVYNDALNCARWCASARECLGEAAYRNATDVKKGRDHPSVPDKEASI